MSDMETKVFLEEADVKKDFISDRKENGLKCPFCNQELRKISATSFLVCDNCNITGFDKLWQELIRTRKALEIATKCINWVIDTFQKGLEHESDVVGCCELSLERIEELEQKDK